MTVLPPSDAAGAFEARLRNMERQIAALTTSRRTPFTEVYDEDGNLAMRFDAEGISVFDDDGNPQLRAGDLDGMGDYGVDIGGGRARALDITTQWADVSDVSLNTTMTVRASVTVAPPAWATQVFAYAWMVFGMHNPTAGVVGQHYRIDFDGNPGTGYWKNDVQAGGYEVANESYNWWFVDGNGIPPFDVDALAAVHAGTNSTNSVRLQVLAFHLR